MKKSINVKYKVRKEFLVDRGIDVDDINETISYLGDLFSTRYEALFHREELSEADIDSLLYYRRIFEKIESLPGFVRFIAQYDNHNHAFTARVAGFLMDKGYEVELEPDMGKKSGPHPDLKFEKDGQVAYGECKTSDITNFYKLSEKEAIADLVYEMVSTSDQITLYLREGANRALVEEVLNDRGVVQTILRCYEAGKDGKESNVELHDLISANIIQRPAILGAEEDFLITARMDGFLEDIESGLRWIGSVIMRGGRSIGVYSEVDYTNKWKDKKEQSKKQMMTGHPNIVFVDENDVVGRPELHAEYMDSVWLTEELPECSAVVLFGQYSNADGSLRESTQVFHNKKANYPVDLQGF